MKLSNRQLVEAQSALKTLLNTNLPVTQAYHIKKTLESIKVQMLFLEDQIKGIIKKHGVCIDGDAFEIPESDVDGRKKYFADYEELMIIEEEIDVRKLSLNELAGIEITANELETIEFLISEE